MEWGEYRWGLWEEVWMEGRGKQNWKRKVASCHGYGQCSQINRLCCMCCSVTRSPQRPAQPPCACVCISSCTCYIARTRVCMGGHFWEVRIFWLVAASKCAAGLRSGLGLGFSCEGSGEARGMHFQWESSQLHKDKSGSVCVFSTDGLQQKSARFKTLNSLCLKYILHMHVCICFQSAL